MPDASPLRGVMEPGYMPAGKETNIAGLRPLARDGCGRPRSCVSAYIERQEGEPARLC